MDLALIGEPELDAIAARSVYRLILLPSGMPNLVIRVETTGGPGAQVHVRRFVPRTLEGGDGFAITVVGTATLVADAGATQRFLTILHASDFWRWPAADAQEAQVLDGVRWHLDARDGAGRRHSIQRRNPRERAVLVVGSCFLGLAGLSDLEPALLG